MSLQVFWSEDALREVEGIFSFIAQDSLNNANLVADRIEHTIDLLSKTPFGRQGRMKNTYEAVVPKTPFIIAYQLENKNSLTILHVIHGARDWKAGKWPS
jgi:toxin ParE1/3/4